MRNLSDEINVCVTVTLVDGLVLARSAFHHSMNYRSVVILGRGLAVTDREEKLRVLEALVEHVAAGRAAEVRGPNEAELRATLVIAMPLAEASAKVRTGPAVDDEADYSLPIWAGIVPMSIVAGVPEADERLIEGTELPQSVLKYARPSAGK